MADLVERKVIREDEALRVVNEMVYDLSSIMIEAVTESGKVYFPLIDNLTLADGKLAVTFNSRIQDQLNA